VKRNRIKELVGAGEIPLGHMVVEFWTRGIAKMLEGAGFDFLVFDMEHTGWTTGDLADQMAWMKGTHMTPVVRIPVSEYHHISRSLDVGAQGIMVPRVESADEVRRVVEAVKYPPLGKRGLSFCIAHDDYLLGDVPEMMQRANDETLVIVQIEKVGALDDLEEIAAIPGVDVLWPGQYDLSASMGITGETAHPRIAEAIDRVVAVAQEAGLLAGIQPTSVDQATEWIEKGFNCISYSEDMLVYLDACSRTVGELRSWMSARAVVT
jgi:2-dehydro-3-deoxyglucarate aldolase/4-hydroxy-2-oxoheptanedioate aldolase